MKALIRDLDEGVDDEVDWKLCACIKVPQFFLIFSFHHIFKISLCCALNSLSSNFQLDEDDFQEEQNSVAQLIQMLHNDDPEEMLKVIMIYFLLNYLYTPFMD